MDGDYAQALPDLMAKSGCAGLSRKGSSRRADYLRELISAGPLSASVIGIAKRFGAGVEADTQTEHAPPRSSKCREG